MWPFSEMSLTTASLVGTLANWGLLFSLVAGVISTFVIVKTSDVKEEHWARDRQQSNVRIAELNNETQKLREDNLALQTAMLPRHLGVIGIDGPPMSSTWFAGMQQFAGTKLEIQFSDDPEAKNLANEVAIVAMQFGWRPEFIDSKRSHVDPARIADGIEVSYPTGKPWSEAEPVQPWFAWAKAAEFLADSLTKAGMAVGDRRVSRYGFDNKPPDFPGLSIQYFDPPLEGVYVKVGSRRISETIQWIKSGRLNVLGEPPPAATIK
jgi:hypothetical protein